MNTPTEPEEGVIKFRHHHQTGALDEVDKIQFLNTIRDLAQSYGVVGVIESGPEKGIGYGNVSCRLQGDQFLITGTQTGHLKTLESKHYVKIVSLDFDEFFLSSFGQTQPSSESLTHGILYKISSEIGAIVHGHHAKIWQTLLDDPTDQTLKIPASIAYGTKSLVDFIRQSADRLDRYLVTAGHQDGFFVWGHDGAEVQKNLNQLVEEVGL